MMADNSKTDSLEERLRGHAQAFEGLLSIIPAKYYYGQDTSDQWQKKKQTKEQARAAKMAKLDPDNYKSAKDVLDEQAAAQRKRKREEEGDHPDMEGIDTERPLDPNSKRRKKTKKQKREGKGAVSTFAAASTEEKDSIREHQPDEKEQYRIKSEKRRKKRDQKKEKAEKKAATAEAKKERKAQATASAGNIEDVTSHSIDGGEEDEVLDVELEAADMRAGDLDNERQPSTAPSSSPDRFLDADTSTNHSGSSSISSIQPPVSFEPSNMQSKSAEQASASTPPPKPDAAEIQARFQARIEALRAARKADGPNGAPARNRQELLEARRHKETARKLHKKELRQKGKEEEALKKAETLARGSPLLTPGSPMSPIKEPNANNFSFGRVAFGNGERASANLNAILERKGKQKGPSDPATALAAAQNKQQRLASLDSAKQSDITEKDVWLSAKKRVQGERIRDDTSLLKKTLKRKQKQKKKSEKEWGERIAGIKKGQEIKQKKREANLDKRKDDKGGQGKKSKKPKARPGFEGSFRAKAPSGNSKGKE